MFKGFSNIGKAAADGKLHYQYVTKTALPVIPAIGNFVDANQSSGLPVYNAFAGTAAAFTPLIGQRNQGINIGNFLPDSTKHLLRLQLLNLGTSVPNVVYLSDYLGFYSLIDGDDADIQFMDNSQTLPRYTDGVGVRAIFITSAPMVATASVTVTYTNSNGVSGRQVTFNVIAGAVIGQVVNTSGTDGAAATNTPFMPLSEGDLGIRSIEEVQFASGAGGFICIALVKPIANSVILEVGVPSEKNFGINNQMLPEIKEGAYLNFAVSGHSGTNGTTNIRAELIFINS